MTGAVPEVLGTGSSLAAVGNTAAANGQQTLSNFWIFSDKPAFSTLAGPATAGTASGTGVAVAASPSQLFGQDTICPSIVPVTI